MKTNYELIKKAYHRNGISGTGFYVTIFKYIEDEDERIMLGVIFPESGSVAVFQLDLLANQVIEFFHNSWRGDHFEYWLREQTGQLDG